MWGIPSTFKMPSSGTMSISLNSFTDSSPTMLNVASSLNKSIISFFKSSDSIVSPSKNFVLTSRTFSPSWNFFPKRSSSQIATTILYDLRIFKRCFAIL